MASLITNPVTNAKTSHRIKRKKKNSMMNGNHKPPSHASWKSEAQQQIYSSKLLQALSDINLIITPPPSPPASRGGRAVREAADRALAVAAKGERGGVEPFLRAGLNRNFESRRNRRRGEDPPPLPWQPKVKVLGRLVPGCRKESLPVILEEACDYIASLEMQVRAMSSLADLLSGSGATSSSSSPPPTSQ
ncbi:Detected protein of confused Function [Hibiscus syriacus]|uniref:Detected protein of confused Function n=1 Tax=Hibiscus syriacus TaxID=106335 RepID=A0A6A3CP78_HIBSY|nr:Detected protein of confused Function [Hibiscus syriacus]